jgi:hypothetical protein
MIDFAPMRRWISSLVPRHPRPVPATPPPVPASAAPAPQAPAAPIQQPRTYTIGDQAYAIEATLGSGTEGVVYRGRGRDGRAIAIKVIDVSSNPGCIRRVADLVRYAARRPPPASLCLPIASAVRETAGARYLLVAMPLVEPLQLIAEVRAAGRPFLEMVAMAGEAAVAMAYIEAAGGLHHDFSVRNIPFRVTPGQRPTPVILDCDGISLAVNDDDAETDIAGTPGFIAADVLCGGPTEGADRFAGAVWLFAHLFNRHPYAGARPWPMGDCMSPEHRRALGGPWILDPHQTGNRCDAETHRRLTAQMHACGSRLYRLFQATFSNGMTPRRRPRLAAYSREIARLERRLSLLPDARTAILAPVRPGDRADAIVGYGLVTETGWMTQLQPGPVQVRGSETTLHGRIEEQRGGNLSLHLDAAAQVVEPVSTAIAARSPIPLIPHLRFQVGTHAWTVSPLRVHAVV